MMIRLLRLTSRYRRVKRRLTGCCLFIIFGGLLACGAFLSLSFYLAGRAGAQEPREPAHDVLLLIDTSPSMAGIDPDRLRLEAARLFINYLGLDGREAAHRLGIIFFGGEARLAAPLTPLTDTARRAELADLLDDPPQIAWTDHAAALSLAEETFAASPASANTGQAVIILTDGKPEWSLSPTEPETAAAIARLHDTAGRFAARGSPLFIILLQNQAAAADPELETVYVPLWQDLAATNPAVHFYRVHQAEELLGIYHDIVVKLTGRLTAGVVIHTQVRTEHIEPVGVESGLARLTFVVHKSDPALRVTISRPDGHRLAADQPDVQHGGRPDQSVEIWAVTAPPAGRWQVQLNGQGSVTVWKDVFPAPPTPIATPKPTTTPSPTASLPPRPTTTATLQPTATLSPTDITISGQSSVMPMSESGPPAAGSPAIWWLGLPLLIMAAGGGWYWLHQVRATPYLSGVLVRGATPGLTGPTLPARLDLDHLARRQLTLGPQPEANIHLPGTPDQPTPAIRLIGRLDPDGVPGVIAAPAAPFELEAEPSQINNLPLKTEHILHDGDLITLGAYRFKYENLRRRSPPHHRRPPSFTRITGVTQLQQPTPSQPPPTSGEG